MDRQDPISSYRNLSRRESLRNKTPAVGIKQPNGIAVMLTDRADDTPCSAMPGKWEGKSKKTDSSNLGNLYTKHFKANHCGLKVLSSFSLCSAHTGQGDDEEERGKMTLDTWHNLSLLFLNFLPLMILFLIPFI